MLNYCIKVFFKYFSNQWRAIRSCRTYMLVRTFQNILHLDKNDRTETVSDPQVFFIIASIFIGRGLVSTVSCSNNIVLPILVEIYQISNIERLLLRESLS